MTETTTMKFDNGLTPSQQDELHDIQAALSTLAIRIEDLGRHRNYSTAITKLDEARFWLRDRTHRPA